MVPVEGELDGLAACFDGVAGEVVDELSGDFLCQGFLQLDAMGLPIRVTQIACEKNERHADDD